jgi:curved DNA-binding protein
MRCARQTSTFERVVSAQCLLQAHEALIGTEGRAAFDDIAQRHAGGQPFKRMFSLRMSAVDATGHATMQEQKLEVSIPKGVREGRHLRLAGQGAASQGGAAAGDLNLEIEILPHPVFRLDGGDIFFDLPVTPWEAVRGATVAAPAPDGSVPLSVPPGSTQGRRLRLKDKGLPGKVRGDLYPVLTPALPPSASEPEQDAWRGLARAFAAYNPRAALEA